MERSTRFEWLPLVILAVVLVVTYWRLLMGEAFFWGLPALQFVPWRAYGWDMVRAGQWPLWNPYNGGGAPLMANYQSAFLYPLNWPGVLMPSYAALGWLMSVTAVIHLWLAGFFMWLFVGRLGLQPLGRGVSTLAYAMTSYTVARLGTYPIVSAVVWVPFILWAVDRLMAQGRLRDVAWLALGVGMLLLAGHAQTAWYGLLLAGFYALWRVRWGWRRLLWAFWGVILGVGMAGLQLIATADLLRQSARAEGYGAEDLAFRYSYALARLMNLIAPNSFGNPGNGSYLPSGLHYEYGVYVGMIVLLGAIFAIFKRTKRHPLTGFWTGILLVGFVLALGNNTPIFPFLYRHVPTFDMFQAPVRWHLWTVFALSILGGIGADAWHSGPRVIFWSRLMTAGALGGAIVVGASRWYLSADLLAMDGVHVLIDALVTTWLWLALAGGLTLLVADNVPERYQPLPLRWSDGWRIAVWVILALDLAVAMRGLNPTVPAQFYASLASEADGVRRYWPSESLDLVLFGQRVDEEDELVVYEPDELEGLGITAYLYPRDYRIARDAWQDFRALNLPNMNLLDRRYLFNNNEPLVLASYDAVLSDAAVGRAAIGAVYDEQGDVVDMDTVSRVALTAQEGAIAQLADGYNRVHITLSQVAPQSARIPITLTLYDAPMHGWMAMLNGEPVTWTIAPDEPLSRQVTGLVAGDNVIEMVYRPAWLWPGVIVSVLSSVIVMVLFVMSSSHQNKSE